MLSYDVLLIKSQCDIYVLDCSHKKYLYRCVCIGHRMY